MKLDISKDGYLTIERAGKFKSALCPYDVNGVTCGDWCALFGEAIMLNRVSTIKNTAIGVLVLCNHNELTFTELTDNREV